MNNIPDHIKLLSPAQSKLIRSLQQKKYRDQFKLFIVEGNKIVSEYIKAHQNSDCKIKSLCATPKWFSTFDHLYEELDFEIFRVKTPELKRLSNQVTPQEVLAVIEKPDPKYNSSLLKNKLSLAFDSIRDPGNLGTIIRTADWFGIETIFCSEDSVDLFNPKVIQSGMGSTLRVNLFYCKLTEIFEDAIDQGIPIYGTYMSGEDMYRESIPTESVIVFGNESSGISKELRHLITHKISIPEYPENKLTTESLNIATAMAIISSEVRRINR